MTNTRRNITQPADWWAAFDAAAQAGGTDLSAWLGEAGRRMLPRAERKKLSERVTRGRPVKECKSDGPE